MNTLKKTERIVSKKLIEWLFLRGSSQSKVAYPLRGVFLVKEREDGGEPVQILVSVPKKRFRHAVDRNRVKRQVREAYRLNKQLLVDSVPGQQSVALVFVWLGSEHVDSRVVASRVRSLLKHVAGQL